jgi:sec-independent protein translocase protein TatC
MEKPIVFALAKHHMDTHLVYHNPIDPFNMYLKISFMAGCILACPFVLYEVWLFISPGLYQNERRYIVPFMTATIGLFLAGAYFGYRWVYPGSLDFLLGLQSGISRPHRDQRVHRPLSHRDPRPRHHL